MSGNKDPQNIEPELLCLGLCSELVECPEQCKSPPDETDLRPWKY